MSLFSSIQMAGNSLRANEIALQVVGQNIANANTPGYVREEAILTPAPTQRYGGLLLGSGVDVKAVTQKVDKFLEERLRGALSEEASSNALQETYAQLEGVVGALSDTSLSSLMNKFFSSISEILNQPESASVRNLAMLQGQTLAQGVNHLAEQAHQMRSDLNDRVQGMATDVNRLIEDIRALNVRISTAEGGNTTGSDAVGLRDQRLKDLQDLAKLVNIRTVEGPTGGVTVYCGGDYLVADGMSRQVEVKFTTDRGLNTANLYVKGTDSPLEVTSGELHGLISARDDALGGFLDKLDSFAGTLAFEFNKVYSSGQGLHGFTEMTSQDRMLQADAALNDAGLRFSPQNGSFQVQVLNTKTGLTKTTDVKIDLQGLGHDTTLNDLRDALNQISGIQASIDGGRLKIISSAQDSEFSFGNDTSGVLAALGLNTFFTGSTANDLAVNADVQTDPARFAASRNGIGTDTANAVDLAAFLDRPLDSINGLSIGNYYDRITSETTQASAMAKATAQGDETFATTLQGQALAISGVNIDEETVRMLGYQRAYQASAKYIAALNELFQVLVTL